MTGGQWAGPQGDVTTENVDNVMTIMANGDRVRVSGGQDGAKWGQSDQSRDIGAFPRDPDQ